jgi:YD repeat-containing protein
MRFAADPNGDRPVPSLERSSDVTPWGTCGSTSTIAVGIADSGARSKWRRSVGRLRQVRSHALKRPQGRAATTTAYDRTPTGELRATSTTQNGGSLEIVYDRLGREIRRTWDGVGKRALIETGYDPAGRVARASIPRWVGEPYRFEVFTYDDMARLTGHEHPDFSWIRFSYRGLTTERVDEKGNRQTVSRDGLGRIVESVRNDGGNRTTPHSLALRSVRCTPAGGRSWRQ